jgi:hypothetical protein
MAKGDITGWTKGLTMHQYYLTSYKAKLREKGLVGHPGGFSSAVCPDCGYKAMVGIDFRHPGTTNDEAAEWVEQCLNCGKGHIETPLFDDGLVQHVSV